VSDAIDRAIARYGADAVCAALEPLLTPERIARIDAVLAARLQSVVTVVEDTYDPHNAAAAIRTTEALGLCELHVIEPGARFSAAGGVTRGAHRWLELVRWSRAEDAIAACDGAIGVPMYGFTESFNLSVTVALAMSRIAARRRQAIGAPGDLGEERRRELRARWFALKIRGAAGILERTLK